MVTADSAGLGLAFVPLVAVASQVHLKASCEGVRVRTICGRNVFNSCHEFLSLVTVMSIVVTRVIICLVAIYGAIVSSIFNMVYTVSVTAIYRNHSYYYN